MAFLVTGHQRSGTTLLSRLFSDHPELGMTNEFGNFLRVGESYGSYRRRLLKRWGGIVVRSWPLSESFGARGPYRSIVRQNNRLVMRYLAALRRRKPERVTAAVIDRVLRELFPGASVVGDKYPEYVFSLDRLVADNDLDCLVICRDCRDVTSSTLVRARSNWRRMPLFVRKVDTAEKVARRWVHAMELMEQHRERLFVLRYEDLVTEVTGPLRAIAEWLDIDPAGFQAKEISSRSIGKYRQGLTRDELDSVMEIAGPTMERLGYV